MSGTIEDQKLANLTWQMIEEVDASRKQSNTQQKKGEGKVAAQNRSQQQLLDLIVAAETGKPVQQTPGGGPAAKPQLPNPDSNSQIFGGGDDQDQGLISIIGQVLALQAKTNSNFWSSLWKQASQSMEMQVNFAPVVGAAIKAQYQAQSDATAAQAEQSSTDAWINIGMFAFAGFNAGMQEVETPDSEINNAKDVAAVDKTAEANAPSAEQAIQATQEELNVADDVMNGETDSWWPNCEKTWEKAKSLMSRGKNIYTSFSAKLAQNSQMTQVLAQASTGWNDAKYQGRIAAQQVIQGQNEAVSQEAQMYSQFYGQDYTRMEDLRQGSGQNLDYAMNMLQQASNTITQTVTSMFRG